MVNVLMKQRIQNLLVDAGWNGVFHPVDYVPDTGAAVTNTDDVERPVQVVCNEISAYFDTPRRQRRVHRRERISWIWRMEISFAREVTCSEFEDALCLNPPRLDKEPTSPVEQQDPLNQQATLHLTNSEYQHPPMQDSPSGSLLTLTFEAELTPV